jgi:hypothetical protein
MPYFATTSVEAVVGAKENGNRVLARNLRDEVWR